MKAEELAFWIQWYADWHAALANGALCVWKTDYTFHSPEVGFEEIVLHLAALVERALEAPISCSIDEAFWEPSGSDEGTDWPIAVAPEAAPELRRLVRAPYMYAIGASRIRGPDGTSTRLWMREPSFPCYPDRHDLDSLVVGVRAAVLLLKDAPQHGEEHHGTARALLNDLADRLFPLAMSSLHFLSAKEVDAIVVPLGPNRLAIAPFQRFVSAESPADMLRDSEDKAIERDRESKFDDDNGYDDPYGYDPGDDDEPTCDLCFQEEGDCQCGTKD